MSAPLVRSLVAAVLCCAARLSLCQGQLATVPRFDLDKNPMVIRQPAQARRPFSVVGERGAILGQQDGTFELWLLPVKVLSHAHLVAHIAGYDAPIDLNAQASEIEVRPDHTTITYSHATITVKQHMFIPRSAPARVASAIVLFEVHAIAPADLTLSFDPAMERQWPAPNFGRPNGSWIAAGSGGAYALNTDNPAFFGFVAMPNATHGPIRPYQERAATEPLQFQFHYDPKVDDNSFYPLLSAVSSTEDGKSQTRADLLRAMLDEGAKLSQSYGSTSELYLHFFDRRLTVSSPDKGLDEALRWAEVSIEQSRVAGASGLGLAGGWYTSGDSARPGFGWFFGRDTLWTLYAVNSYGDFALSREAMNFLLAHQRADGKMMHEYSQTASDVDWEHLPYLYAAADATPLFVMQMEDYVRTSGDLDYLKQHWDNVKRAYAFTRAHTTDGIYDNSQGTGWVEEWVPKMPHQEIYLAALDQQSAESISRLALLMHDQPTAEQAEKTASDIRARLAEFRGADGMYRFSRDAAGTYEATPSVFPAVAWWSGHLALPQADETFRAWASPRFSTDWGIRSVATDSEIYNPISYHHGSVWPLYAGWSSMAEYRTGRPLQAFSNLRATAELTWLQDPGAVTEVLSGAYLQPLGRSSSHQLWSSAMVFAPAIRGLFGLEADALHHTLHVAPQLPADWDHAEVKNLWVGSTAYTVQINRAEDAMVVDALSQAPTVLCLLQGPFFEGKQPCTAKASTHHTLSVPLPPIEVAVPFVHKPEGEATTGLKVIEEARSGHELTLTLAAPAGSHQKLFVRRNGQHALHADGADLEGDELRVSFATAPAPAAAAQDGYVEKAVTLRW